MSFWGKSFVFNGIPSETYSLTITSPDGGEVQTNGSSDVSLYTQEIYRRPTKFLLGVQQTPVLEFPVTFNVMRNDFSAQDAMLVQQWLFGHSNYKNLQIMQNDISEIVFKCFLTSPKIIMTGNVITGFSANVTCDAPWGWGFPKTTTYTYTVPYVNTTLVLNNRSGNNFYTYPTISFTMNSFGGDISITNTSDASRIFLFEDVSPLDVVTVNNDLEIVTSATGLLVLSKFNKNFFRLKSGVNTLTLTGNISSLSFTYTNAKKIGG